MYLKVDLSESPAAVALAESDDFGRFHVEVFSGGMLHDGHPSEGVRAHLGAVLDGTGIGRFSDHGEEILVEVAAVRRLAGDAAGTGWEAGFQKMFDYAASKGWADPAGSTIQAHLDWKG